MTFATVEISASAHPIKSVTIFKSSKAEVNRTFSVDLKTGQNKIQISDLSSNIDTESVRVSGLGQARLFDVVCTVEKKQDADLSPDSSSEVIRLLKVKKQALQGQKSVRTHESELLVMYAKTLAGEHVSPTAMSEFLKTFVDKGIRNLEDIAEIDKNIVEVTRMVEKESAKTARRTGEANGQVTIVVVAAEDSKAKIKLTYIVSGASWEPTYELHATTENGKPSSSVSLHYRARINQSTGEDWKNAALMLSTVASDMFAKIVPHLKVAKIQPGKPQTFGLFGKANPGQADNGIFSNFVGQPHAFGQQQQQQPQQQTPSPFSQSTANTAAPAPGFGAFGAPAPHVGSDLFRAPIGFGASSSFGSGPSPSGLFGGSSFGTAATYANNAFGGAASTFGTSAPSAEVSHAATAPPPEDDVLSAFEEITGPGPFSEPATVVTESPLSVSYAVEGKSTIPSDGVAHQVSVAVLSFDSKVTHVCCPKIEARVYLQCEVKNTTEFRLLPGLVSVFLDDSYVSKTSIQDINPSDTFNCTLGADPATTLSYSRSLKTTRSNGGTFAEVTYTTTYINTTTIHNKHRFPLSEITIRDVIPISEDKRIQVLLRKPDGLVDAKDGQVVDLKKSREGLKVRWSPPVDGKGGEKEGRFEFLWKVDAGAKVTVVSEWEVKAPAGAPWHETTAAFA